MEDYKISVVVLTYNPQEMKLLATLRSILNQKNIRFQIIVADDGSAKPGMAAAEALFAECGFQDYVLVANEHNQGTVHNIHSALERCTGKYVKAISPGDLLSGENVLRQWVDAMEAAGAAVSCAEAVYYVTDDGNMKPVVRKTNPQYIHCYLKNKPERARYNYLVLDDLFLGAAIICRTDLQKSYVREILGKVIYAEDHVYRLMAYDRIPMHYYPESCILYETAAGISTSGNQFWAEKLRADWNAANQLLLERCTGKAPVDKYLTRLINLPRSGLKAKLIKYLTIPGTLVYRLRAKFCPRTSVPHLPDNR